MGTAGKYIYGIIDSDTEERFSQNEISTLGGACHLDVLKHNRNAGQAYTVSFQDISAVLSDQEVVDFHHMPKEALAELLLRHQQVIEGVMAKHTIIPMKIGTFAGNDDEVKDILAKGYRTVKDLFERARNTIEIDVAATLSQFDAFLREISEEGEVKLLRQSLSNKRDGVTIDDQMRVGLLVEKCLDEKRKAYADQIRSALGEIAQDVKAHDLMDDKMVLNTAFLIDRSKRGDFEQKVEELDHRFQGKLNFRCVGPLPPYSFYTLEVKKAQFAQVDWARRTLGLTDDFVTANDIKKAHRKLALTCHPDKNPDASGIEKKFNDMTRAYRILLDYYRASNPTGQAEGCFFNEEVFEKNSVLVAVAE